MRARLLGAVVALAVIAIVIIWWRGGRGQRPAADAPTPAATGGSALAGHPASLRGANTPAARIERARTDPASGADPGIVDEQGTRTYVMDNGAVVQDHRGDGAGPPMDPPPMPPSKRTMNPEITAKVYQQLKPLVTACGAKTDPKERGDDPFTYVTMTVAVTKGTLTPTDVYPTVHDLKGASADKFTDCVRKQALTLEVPDSGEPDRTDYVVQYPIRLK